MSAPKATKLDKISKKITKISGLVSAVVVISGAVAGVGNWMSAQVTGAISNQLNDFREEVKASDAAQNQAITRLELMNLMQNDPTNIVAIEKMAKYYFGTLDGDQYMTQKYSDWCREYDGDASIAIGEVKE